MSLSYFRLNPVVASLFYLLGQFGPGSLYYSALIEHMYEIWLDIVKQSFIMCDDYATGLWGFEFVYSLGHNAQCIHIQCRIVSVEEREFGFAHSHLAYLVAFLLTSAESFVYRTVGQFAVEFHNLAFLSHEFEEIAC